METNKPSDGCSRINLINSFVAVHVGAGFHSLDNELSYKKLCKQACIHGMKALTSGSSAVDAITLSIKYLEDSSLTNAGYGSNLTDSGNVECDSSIMDGKTGDFGAIGAVHGVRNPIVIAKEILTSQREDQELGKIPPCFLVSEGARKWALDRNLDVVSNEELISDSSRANYKKYKKRLNDFKEDSSKRRRLVNDENHLESNGCKDSINSANNLLDTVGAVCIDRNGNIASGVSSGGIMLKHSGRVGQAAVYGCGCWAEEYPEEDTAIAVCTTGGGEYLIKSMLCRKVAEKAMKQENLVEMLSSEFKRNIIDKNIEQYEGRLAGILLLKAKSQTLELQWGHTTESMGVGYMAENMKSPAAVITRHQPHLISKEVNIHGCNFNLNKRK